MNRKISITETADPVLLASLNREVQTLHSMMYPEIFKPFEMENIELAMRKIVTTKGCKCYIATHIDEICGYVITYIREYPETAFTFSRKSIYIDQLSVVDKFRNTGVGKQLLNHVYNMALYSGIRRIELDHWSANTPAGKFFRKNGFEIYREMLMKEV